MNCPIWIFNVSDLWPESAVRLGVIRKGFGLSVAEWLEAFCYRKAWLVTGQSKEILQSIKERFPEVDTYHLANGVDTSVFCPACRSNELRRKLGAGGNCLAVFAGLHGLAQGLGQVLEAARLLDQTDGLRIVFVGDGPEKEALVAKSQALGLDGRICFLDPVPWESMPALVASADIALVPLKVRLPGAVPSKLYEAMGSGVPIILIADGEPADIVRAHGAGVVVSPGSPQMLAEQLRVLCHDEPARRRMGLSGRRAAEEQYNRSAIARAFVDYLERRLAPESQVHGARGNV